MSKSKYQIEMEAADKALFEANQKVLEYVKSIVSKDYFKEIEEIIKDSEWTYNFAITKNPKGEYQDEEDYPNVKGYYVDQTTSGYSSDSYNGTVSIKISDTEFLEFYYSM